MAKKNYQQKKTQTNYLYFLCFGLFFGYKLKNNRERVRDQVTSSVV